MNLFSPGPRLDAPQGDTARQAVASLRGYAYQVYASAIAWLGLADAETLYLEVAEDFAVAGRDAIVGTQVRDTAASGSITLQSEVTRKAIDAFVDLTLRNQGRAITFHYLTTSEIGIERILAHRIEGGSALSYWRRAAAGADIAPLRTMVAQLDLKPVTKAYLAALSEREYRSTFLSRIHWHCGAPGLADVRSELEAGLIEFVSTTRRLPSAVGRQIVPAVVEHVLLRAISSDTRRLRRADLLELVDQASRVSLPIGQISDALAGGAGMFSRASLLVPASELPVPRPFSPRAELIRSLDHHRRSSGAVFATGGMGLGKSISARLAAGTTDDEWSIADFRDLGAIDTATRLSMLIGEMAAERPAGIILDDLNEADDPRVRDQLSRLLASLRRRDATAIITAYRPPAPSTLHALCPGGVPVVEIAYLDVEEVQDLVVQAGGEAKFGRPLHRAAAHGHPLMTMSLVLQLSYTGWDRAAIAKLLGSGADGELAIERRTARSRLMAAMPTDAVTLLLRTSLIGGRFDRDMAVALGKVIPPVPLAGLAFDRLVGAWIEPRARNRFRVSPLLDDAAAEVLTEAERRDIHQCVAERILRGEDLAVDDIDVLTRHTLLSGDDELAIGLASAIIVCGEEMLEVVAGYSGRLQRLGWDKPILPQHPRSSAMLRLAQLRALLPFGSPEAIRSCWEALKREKAELIGDGVADAAILSKLLLNSRASKVFPEWLELLAQLDRIMLSDERVARANDNFRALRDDLPHGTGVMFASQMRSVETVSAFRTLAAFTSLAGRHRRSRQADAVRQNHAKRLVLHAV